MQRIIKNALSLVILLASSVAFGQQEVAMADGMRSEGKIYVVVAIILLVLIGFITFLVLLDRKVSKLEKQISKKK